MEIMSSKFYVCVLVYHDALYLYIYSLLYSYAPHKFLCSFVSLLLYTIPRVQSCQHKMCTLCYVRGQMTTQQGPHRCPVPNCNKLATSCEYFCFSSATSEIMNPTQSQSNLFPPMMSSTPSPTMRKIGTVTPAPRKSPAASDEDDNTDFGRSSGESLDTPDSNGAEALLMFANDNSSVDYSGGYVAGGGSMGEEDYSTDNVSHSGWE